eukprot:CAMPEP_0119106252 /NCGR_PEP_ID=MMETSP1180-20130426/3997_1 /TAXON_ID=3052 ORGANISM="Chlamydomonas cf sp, Strain CCMP681" /NCGR_SAMPLE_ID=MMETSP1180 /ASSEMBLY_ACC=CAM_ASM_000741 /LENGTH=268 /DNA_ID=CAMNT_0007091539 /DNA_START=84 /DNA_END=890 /DNA_ORIENTATION=+
MTASDAVAPSPKQLTREEQQETKILELKALLKGDEGRTAGDQLVQGGELISAAELCSDKLLHKWLRARGWDVQKAYNSILKHAAWRVTNMPNGIVEPSTIANELACDKAFIQGVDRKGRPLLIIQVRKHNGWTRTLGELERFCCFLLDACAKGAADHPEINPRGQLCALLDLTDMGAVSMDIAAIKTLFQLLGEHYVERLGAMYFWNPSYLFWGAWNTLSPLLPEPTRNKIKVIDPATQAHQLHELIDPSVLPVEYGGQAALGVALGK